MQELKLKAIASSRAWKSAGKPRSGSIFFEYRKDKLLYKKRVRDEQAKESISFTNDLHEALLRKSGQTFWKCWRSKFDNKVSRSQPIDGAVDGSSIASNFAKHFETVCRPFSDARNSDLKARFESMISNYCSPLNATSTIFDVQLISELISQMENGKAAGLDDLSCEHLKYSHPVATVILCKLFNIFLAIEYLPRGFGLSYTVPIPKCDGRALSVEDFRGISISPVVSKLFELAVLNRFSDYFQTADNQFGFKKHLGCRHAVYCLRNVIERYTANNSTVNVCSLDLSKAFDKMNHFALFIKLIERRFPKPLLNIFIMWFDMSFTCVRWYNHYSYFFKLLAGVRQGGVLSPYFFAIFINDIVSVVEKTNVGCYVSSVCVGIILYADDIVLLAPSVEGLQILLSVCEEFLSSLDMKINVKKSCCIRFGIRHDYDCANLVLCNGGQLPWSTNCRYLGVYLISAKSFRCSFEKARAKFYRAFNGIFGKVGRFAPANVILSLITAKCLPVLLYATEACPVLSRDVSSLRFAMTRAFMKVFRTRTTAVVDECLAMFGVLPIKHQLHIRKVKFLREFKDIDNNICSLFNADALKELLYICNSYSACQDNVVRMIIDSAGDRLFS